MRLLLCSLLVTGGLAFSCVHAEENVPGQFDYYLLNLSWQPQFCHLPRHRDFDECKTTGKGFMVHGLWPQYVQGYPEHCSLEGGLADPSRMLDIMPSRWLVQHEWETHGTCSGLAPEKYFETLRKVHARLVIPKELKTPASEQMLTPAAIKQAFIKANPKLKEENMAIGCGNNYLTAMSFCFAKDGVRPVRCTGVHDCRANVVKITPIQ